MWICAVWAKISVLGLSLNFVFCVEFTFTPQNTILHQPAVYQCTVDTDGVTVQWTVNGSSSTSSSITSLGIVTQGAATQNSTLTVPGEAILNGTIVTCIASGLVNGEGYFNTSCAVLYIQGPPQAVDLLCTSICETLYTECNWTVPYTIEGVMITKYNVKITKDELLLYSDSVTDTHYSYLSGTYTISVAAVIGENLEGEVNNWEVNVREGYRCTVQPVKRKDGIWMANYTITGSSHSDLPPTYISQVRVHVCPFDSSVNGYNCEYYNGTLMSILNGTEIVGTVDLEDVRDNEKRRLTFSLEFLTGLQVLSSDSCTLSTFDVQRVDVTQDFFIGVCFQCFYINESSAQGCFIEFLHSVNGNLSILKPNKTECVTGIHSGNYTIIVFDIESDGTVYTNVPAVYQSFNVENTEIWKPEPTIVILSSSISFSLSLSGSTSTEAASSPNPNKPKSTSVGVAVTIVVSVVFLVMVTITIIILLLLVYIKKTTPASLQLGDVELKLNNYSETGIDYNKPQPSLSTVDNQLSQYSVIKHEPQSPSDSEENYSRLDHNTKTADSAAYSTVQHTKYPAAVSNLASQTYSTLQLRNQTITVIDDDSSRSTEIENKTDDTLELKYSFIVSHIASKIPQKWEEFGNALAITPKKLNEIRENHQSDFHRFCDVIQEWQTSRIRPFTKETLNMILQRIGENKIAD